MEAPNLSAIEIKAFVPARDFELSKQFYLAAGFTLAWSSEDLAYFRVGSTSFLLQNFHVQQHADNFMMHLLVESVDDWYRHLETQGIRERFGVRLEPPEDRPWAMRDFVLFDPSGVLWRIAQNLPGKNAEE
jgi:catechol 2,3-dioxygenase-like lactoylglutathione lyase family enzyme